MVHRLTTHAQQASTTVERIGVIGLVLVVLPFLVFWGKAELADQAAEQVELEQALSERQGLVDAVEQLQLQYDTLSKEVSK